MKILFFTRLIEPSTEALKEEYTVLLKAWKEVQSQSNGSGWVDRMQYLYPDVEKLMGQYLWMLHNSPYVLGVRFHLSPEEWVIVDKELRSPYYIDFQGDVTDPQEVEGMVDQDDEGSNDTKKREWFKIVRATKDEWTIETRNETSIRFLDILIAELSNLEIVVRGWHPKQGRWEEVLVSTSHFFVPPGNKMWLAIPADMFWQDLQNR